MGSVLLVLPQYGLHGGWRVRGTNSYQPNTASLTSTSLTTKLNKKEPDRNENYYDRWFVIQGVDDDKPLSRVSPFATDKALKCPVETVKSIKSLRSGDLSVEVSSASQSRSLNKINNLAGCPITANPHRTLNTCKGVICCRTLIDCPKDEILEELKSQGVTDIYNILTKDDSGNRRNTNTFIITFHTASIPKHIKIGYLRIPVELYIPNPLRCFNCQKFGHGKKKHVKEEKSVPSADRLDTMAVLAATK